MRRCRWLYWFEWPEADEKFKMDLPIIRRLELPETPKMLYHSSAFQGPDPFEIVLSVHWLDRLNQLRFSPSHMPSSAQIISLPPIVNVVGFRLISFSRVDHEIREVIALNHCICCLNLDLSLTIDASSLTSQSPNLLNNHAHHNDFPLTFRLSPFLIRSPEFSSLSHWRCVKWCSF